MPGRGIYAALLIAFVLGVESYPHQDSSFGIVGGSAVNITDVPFMARYGSDFPITCGAAVVHERYLITSADCYYTFTRLGSTSYVIIGTDNAITGGEAYDVEEGFPHPSYLPFDPRPDYDIAVLKLVKALKFSDRVQAIPLVNKDVVIPEDAVLDTMGFGSTSGIIFDLKMPNQLQKVSMPIIQYEKCKRSYLELTEGCICAGGDNKGSCYFDHGNPLVYNKMLLGVTSLKGCGEDYPGIYSSVPALREFIDSVINPEA